MKTKIFILGLALLLLLPTGLAAIEILPVNHPFNNIAATNTDYIQFHAGEFLFGFGTRVELKSADLRTMMISLTNAGGTSVENTVVKVFLDGTRGDANTGWVVSGNLVGAAVNGTWTVTVTRSGIWQSTGCGTEAMKLSIQSKTLEYGVSAFEPDNDNRIWNWHVSPTTVCDITSTTIEQNEDPNFQRYYTANADIGPKSFTGGFTINCSTQTASLNMSWLRGAQASLNTYASFFFIEGQFEPDSEFQGLAPGYPNLQETTRTDKGSGSSGTHTSTIQYNNAVGNAYRAVARHGAAGGFSDDRNGITVNIAANQCAIPPPSFTGFSFNPDELSLEVSNAQCATDPVSFTINSDVSQSTNDLDVFIYDTRTNTIVMNIDDSQMWHIPSGSSTGVFFFNRTLAPGPYMAIVRGDFGGLGAVDYFSSRALNVPIGDCTDHSFDILPPIITALNHTKQQLSNEHSYQNVRLNITQFFQNALLNTTHQHIDSHFNETQDMISAIITGNLTIIANFTELRNLLLQHDEVFNITTTEVAGSIDNSVIVFAGLFILAALIFWAEWKKMFEIYILAALVSATLTIGLWEELATMRFVFAAVSIFLTIRAILGYKEYKESEN